jgi:VWFA-related protein
MTEGRYEGVMRTLSWAWLLLLCLPFSALAQQDAPVASPQLQSGEAKPASNPARQIRLDVVVTDKSKKVVSGLQQQDFTVLDSKQPATVLSFQAESVAAKTPDSAVEIVLVVDEVNTTFQRVAYVRAEVKKFLLQNEGKLAHPVSLAFFSDSGTQIQTIPALDGNALSAAFDQHETALRSITRGSGFYGAEDRTRLSLDALEEIAAKEATRPGRKLVLWVSPGWPLLSGPRSDLSQKQEQGVFNSAVRISAALREARVTLYSIDPLGTADAGGLRTSYYQEFVKGLRKPGDAQIGDLALQVIATQSGGLVFYGNNDIANWINRCVADADAFYILTIPAAPADRANDYHDIEVKTATPGLTVRTRTGYYAQP